MPYLSSIARKKKIATFIDPIPKESLVLEAGCGGNWLKAYMEGHGWKNYTGIDLAGSPDIKGDLNDWKQLGMKAASYDIIVAFEIVEHDDLWQSFFDLLKPGGRVLLTTPVPAFDRVLKMLENVGLNQPRTSPHMHLVDVRTIKIFQVESYKRPLGLSQWAILKKPCRL